MPMLIELERRNDVCILCLTGRLAAGTDPEYLRSKADEVKAQGCGKILIDLRELHSIGSTGIGFVVSIYTSIMKNPAGRFVLVGANDRVREVLDLTRLSTILPIAANIDAGLTVLRGDSAAAHQK